MYFLFPDTDTFRNTRATKELSLLHLLCLRLHALENQLFNWCLDTLMLLISIFYLWGHHSFLLFCFSPENYLLFFQGYFHLERSLTCSEEQLPWNKMLMICIQQLLGTPSRLDVIYLIVLGCLVFSVQQCFSILFCFVFFRLKENLFISEICHNVTLLILIIRSREPVLWNASICTVYSLSLCFVFVLFLLKANGIY